MFKSLAKRRIAFALMVLVCGAVACRSAGADDAPIATGQQANGKARVDILSLKRSEGDTITLRFVLVNEGNQRLTLAIGNAKLVDLVNCRLYSPGVTTASCSAEAGERSTCWAVFGMPIGNPKTINVQFYEDFGLISVPLAG